ncbi:alpha/beta hydrolase [Francisellaceae bacterium CB299]|jgi:pimeloyl-ACP methyl ester carboxylesterase
MKKLLKFPVILLSIAFLTLSIGFSSNLKSEITTLNNNKIHYYYTKNDPNKPNLIMLTGRGTTTNFWPKDFIDTLSKKYNLYILDYMGINTDQDSSKLDYSIDQLAKDTNNFIIAKKIKNPYILGWSMGGAVVLETIFEHKVHFKQAFLLSPALPETLTQKSTPPTPFKTNNDIYNYVFKLNLYKYNPKNLNTEKKRFIDSDITKLFPPNETFQNQLKAIKEWRTNPEITEKFLNIDTPTTIFLSNNDGIERIDEMQRILTKVKNKEYISTIYLNNSGHAIDWDQSEKVAKIINTLGDN